MVTITIDGKQISVDENLSILEAAQEADVKIPTLCYLKDVNEVGACKMCVVEVEGSRHLVTSCNTKVIAMSKTPHTQYLCMFARHGNLFYHSKFIVTTSSKWYN